MVANYKFINVSEHSKDLWSTLWNRSINLRMYLFEDWHDDTRAVRFFRPSAVVDTSIKATQASLRAAGVPSVVRFMKSLRVPERACSNQAWQMVSVHWPVSRLCSNARLTYASWKCLACRSIVRPIARGRV